MMLDAGKKLLIGAAIAAAAFSGVLASGLLDAVGFDADDPIPVLGRTGDGLPSTEILAQWRPQANASWQALFHGAYPR